MGTANGPIDVRQQPAVASRGFSGMSNLTVRQSGDVRKRFARITAEG